jgi:hypothetical protein
MVFWALWRTLSTTASCEGLTTLGTDISFPGIGPRNEDFPGRVFQEPQDVDRLVGAILALAGCGSGDSLKVEWPTKEEIATLRSLRNTDVSVPLGVVRTPVMTLSVGSVNGQPFGKMLVLEQIFPNLLPDRAAAETKNGN